MPKDKNIFYALAVYDPLRLLPMYGKYIALFPTKKKALELKNDESTVFEGNYRSKVKVVRLRVVLDEPVKKKKK